MICRFIMEPRAVGKVEKLVSFQFNLSRLFPVGRGGPYCARS
jgi:hypothetical protein